MPPRPVTDSARQTAAFVAAAAVATRGQPVTSEQLARMLQTDPLLREYYLDYHACWSRLEPSVAVSPLAVTDALRRLEGYAQAGHEVRVSRETKRRMWSFVPALRVAVGGGEDSPRRRATLVDLIDAINRNTHCMDRLTAALSRAERPKP